jgi:hypothetical protein
MALIELKGVVEDQEKLPAAGAASVRLSATPSAEWLGFFGQALTLAVAEGVIPLDGVDPTVDTGGEFVMQTNG